MGAPRTYVLTGPSRPHLCAERSLSALRGEGGGEAREARAPLPCQKSNNCDNLTSSREPGSALTSAEKHRVFAIEQNVRAFVKLYGLAHCGLFTITFPADVWDFREAQRRLHNFRRRVLWGLFRDSITVLEFTASGRPHYHLVVACREDIRAGFNFEAYERLLADSRGKASRMPLAERRAIARELTSNLALKQLWSGIRNAARGYGVGRCETIPIRTTEKAVGSYLGGYLKKSVGHRKPEHKGARFVRYSQHFKRPVRSSFSWAGPRGWVWRAKVRQWAVKHGCFSLGDIRRQFGRRWCYRHREEIKAISLSWWPTSAHAAVDGVHFPEGAIDCSLRQT